MCISYTGERFIPEYKKNSIMALEHWHRYLFVEPYVKDKIILDIACGAGYGSNFMSDSAKQVFGVDIDRSTIDYCISNYNTKKNLQFEVKSVDKIDYPNDSFDIVTCFETIEHISEQKQKDAVRLFSKVLKKDGILFISTPSLISPLHIKDNKYHVKELTYNDFYSLLSSHFNYVKVVGQSVCFCSTIGDLNNKNQNVITTQNDISAENCKYLIAICSNSDISHINEQSVYVDNTSSTLVKLTKIRNKIGWVISIYNLCLDLFAKIFRKSKLKKIIECFKW